MKILGLEANIGSMLYPFQEAGHEVIGNYDSRGIVNEDNFNINFPDSTLFQTLNQMVESIKGIDVDAVMLQPSCSKFSQLSRKAAEDYDECINLWFWLGVIKPKFFFIESKLDYLDEVKKMDGYRYHLEWVSNYHYGNTQKGRNRLWVMGIREDVEWEFISGEKYHDNTVEKVLHGLPDFDIESIDHKHVYKPFIKDSKKRTYLSLDEAFDMLIKDGKLSYVASDGLIKTRINRKMANKLTSTTITGGGTWFHWEKKYPLTVREKARIQGFPDEFSFKGLSDTKKDKAVGKSMPFEFTRYLVSLLDGTHVPENRTKIVPEPSKLTIYKNTRLKG